MEDLSADDDILSDILLDTLEFEPAISTHKMNPNYRGQRFDRGTVSQLVRKRVVVERNISAAVEDLGKLGIVRKYLQNKTQRQTASFQAHARRYFETYLPNSGVEFALTTRYKRVMMERLASKAALGALPEVVPAVDASAESSTSATSLDARAKEKGKGRLSLDRAATSIGAAPAASEKADLCVLALQDFRAGDLVSHCKGGLKDLTKAEDEALREEAVSSREKRKEAEYKGVLGPGRDFSVITSSRKGCSQLLLGPARFVNHDCNPNAEFYRMGSQMIFKVIRPIARNEEITTYYGDNYFEWANSECMCATCERRGVGAFSDQNAAPGPEASSADADAAQSATDGAEDANGDSRRRISRRIGRPTGVSGSSNVASPSPTPSMSAAASLAPSEDLPTSERSKREILADMKLEQHGPSEDRSDPHAEGAGPRCRCLTCGATFWAPEKWWTPDECPRCERHYKIFKADWPDRVPTEGLLARRGSGKRKIDAGMDRENGRSQPARSSAVLPTDDQTQPDSKKRGRHPKVPSSTNRSPSVDNNGLAFSNPGTPITLTPLRGPAPSNGVSVPKGRETSLKSVTTLATPLNGTMSEDEEMVDAALAGANAVRRGRRPPKPNKLLASDQPIVDSDDSDLTPESEPDLDDDAGPAPRFQKGVAPTSATSSVSTSPGPMGPKMLGKHAKTDVLAQYWGSPTTDKRSRRKSSSGGGPILLGVRKAAAESRKPAPKRQDHASDSDEMPSQMRKSMKRQTLLSTPEQDDTPATSKASTQIGASGDGNRTTTSTSSPSALVAALIPENGERGQSTGATGMAPASHTSIKTSTLNPSPGPSTIPGLATTGIERTSESNLALFWSAGVEGGRTRRQAHREPQTLTAHTPAKRSRPSSEASRSRTPEVKRHRGRSAKDAALDTGAEGSAVATSGVRDASDAGVQPARMDVDSGGEDGDGTGDLRFRRDSDRASRAPEDQSTAASRLNGHTSAGGPLLPAALLMRPPPFVRPDLLAAARSNSPLAGPPPPGLRAGAPGQPIRKNLRWGSGKTSLSRPIGSVSPLGRPLLGPNGSPLQLPVRPPSEAARVLAFSREDSSPMAGIDAGANGSFPSASAPPDLNVSPGDAMHSNAASSQPRNSQALSASVKAEPFARSASAERQSVPLLAEAGPEPEPKRQSVCQAPSLTSAKVETTMCPPSIADVGISVLKSEPTESAGLWASAAEAGVKPAPEERWNATIRTEESVSQPLLAAAVPYPNDGSLPASAGSSLADPQSFSPSTAIEPPLDAAPLVATADASPQRRVSGRARKPPEMAAGQISYKGSLVKLAAQRAKDAKTTSSPAPASSASTPQRSPTSSRGRKLAPSTSPGKIDADLASIDVSPGFPFLDDGKAFQGQIETYPLLNGRTGHGETATALAPPPLPSEALTADHPSAASAEAQDRQGADEDAVL